MAFVQLDEGENLESALRRFKRKVQQEAIIKEIKKHSVYFKPGEKRRMKEAQARKRMRRRIKRERDVEYKNLHLFSAIYRPDPTSHLNRKAGSMAREGELRRPKNPRG